ncbi:MAG: hypothetical protein Q8O87_04180 [bacterium]|nr:hypothetical protein [bacterium]
MKRKFKDQIIWLLNKLSCNSASKKEYPDRVEWWLNGKLHREDGPAVEWYYGTKEWYINGKRHREDGPAKEWPDGSKSWFLNGEEFTKEAFDKKK